MPPYALVPNPLKADGQPVIFGGGSGSGTIQVWPYIDDPRTEGISTRPGFDPTLANIAYRKTGDGPTFVWDTDALEWV